MLILLTLQSVTSAALLFRVNQVYYKVSELSLLNEPPQDSTETLLPAPETILDQVLPDHVPIRGPDTAPVQIVVFSRLDFVHSGRKAAFYVRFEPLRCNESPYLVGRRI